MHRNHSLHLALVAGLLTAGFGAGRFVADDPDPLVSAQRMSEAFQRISDKVGPAVVQVKAYRSNGRSLQDGSGVIVSDRGHVVTNHHVVRGADHLRVVLTSGSVLDAEIVGTDGESDLAILRVPSRGLTSAPLASDRPKVGEIVLAMGNPMGLGHTVTSGIVSGTGRTDLNVAFYEDFIQTDAAINPGNSGGPLIDLRGQVLGINTAVGLESNGDNGIAFAIPSRMVRKVYDDILQHGYVRRGWLGVQPYSAWAIRRRLGRDREEGYEGVSRIKVEEVVEGSPAEKAGILEGDIILRIHTTAIVDDQTFRNAIAEAEPGQRITVQVWRDGEELELPVRISMRE